MFLPKNKVPHNEGFFDLKKLVPLFWQLADFTPLESSTRFVWQHNILQEHLPGFLLRYCYIL